MNTRGLSLAITVAAITAFTTPVLAGPGGHGGGGPHGNGAPAMSAREPAHEAALDAGKHKGAERGNKRGKKRGLERADEVAGARGDKGRDTAEAKQRR